MQRMMARRNDDIQKYDTHKYGLNTGRMTGLGPYLRAFL
jgi:hypothetical protein